MHHVKKPANSSKEWLKRQQWENYRPTWFWPGRWLVPTYNLYSSCCFPPILGTELLWYLCVADGHQRWQSTIPPIPLYINHSTGQVEFNPSPLNLGWHGNFLWPKESSRNDNVPVPVLGLKRPESFCLHSQLSGKDSQFRLLVVKQREGGPAIPSALAGAPSCERGHHGCSSRSWAPSWVQPSWHWKRHKRIA